MTIEEQQQEHQQMLDKAEELSATMLKTLDGESTLEGFHACMICLLSIMDMEDSEEVLTEMKTVLDYANHVVMSYQAQETTNLS